MSGKRTPFLVVTLAAAGLIAMLAGGADDQPDAVKQLANKLMQTTKVIGINNITTPNQFVEDNDPDTLQIVYITDPKLGVNHVSDDGEVVWFFGDVDVDDQQPYIFQAFEIKAKKRLGIK